MISEIDRWLAAELYRLYVLSQEQIADCLNAQLDAHHAGSPLSLEDVVLRRGYITRRKLTRILETLPVEVLGADPGAGAGAPDDAARLIGPTATGPELIHELSLEEILYHTDDVTVYDAVSPRHGERTLVRVLQPARSRCADEVEIFRREGELQDALHHPNLLKGLGHGDRDGHYFQVTEHIDGAPLSRLIEHHVQFDLARLVRIALQVGCALAGLHEKGLVHTRLHPDDIHLANDGRIKVGGLRHAAVFHAAPAERAGLRGAPGWSARDAACAELQGLGRLLYHLGTGDDSVWRTRRLAKLEAEIVNALRTHHARHGNAPAVWRSVVGRLVAVDPLFHFPHLDPLFRRLQWVIAPTAELLREAWAYLQRFEPKARLRRELEAACPGVTTAVDPPAPATRAVKPRRTRLPRTAAALGGRPRRKLTRLRRRRRGPS